MGQEGCQNQQFGRMNAHLPATLVRDSSNFPRTCPARHPLPSLLKVLHFLQLGQKVRNCDIILHILPGLLQYGVFIADFGLIHYPHQPTGLPRDNRGF